MSSSSRAKISAAGQVLATNKMGNFFYIFEMAKSDYCRVKV